MNCVELFLSHARENPKKMAIWFPGGPAVTFGELEELARRAQKVCLQQKIQKGDSVLLVDHLGPRLYGAVIGILALGASVILVEPWMPIQKINHVIKIVKPKMFLTPLIGKLWGMRVSTIRAIPHWVDINKINRHTPVPELIVESVDSEAPGIITFTSGTTGNPKGVVRNQWYLVNQHRVLTNNLGEKTLTGPDMCIFANFVLLNLASGRGTILIPPQWKPKHLHRLDHLPKELMPESLTCGPAFLLKLMQHAQVKSLKSIHVGGALTDNWIFEEGFKRWPDAHWTHIYGSSEAEPVALADARVAVTESKKRGYFQTLHLGRPIPEILYERKTDGLWIAGPHVCPQYIGNDEENRLNKHKADDGKIWHFMGDRVTADEAGWWYAGRSGQPAADFLLEQKLYSKLESSKLFVTRDPAGKLAVCGENVRRREFQIRQEFPLLTHVVEMRIYRDRRHRARIDRALSIRKGAPWLNG